MTTRKETALPPLQQTLHGYSDGHSLLASSVRLPKDAERLLLLLSDLTGSGGGESFGPYLTGYPVMSANSYALARTWPASEMPRPGCVWTHTLLISNELLESQIQPHVLLPLFRRPTLGTNDFGDYQAELSVPESFLGEGGPEQLDGNFSLGVAEALLRALYGTSDPRTVLAVPRYEFADAPMLAIWRLTWPSLRRRFTFCGGSRIPRGIDGETFLLLAAYERDLRRFDRGNPAPTIVPWTSEITSDENWVRDAADALLNPTRNGLEAFMHRVGHELLGDTALFRPLAQAHRLLLGPEDPVRVAKLIDFAGSEYPDPNQGRSYKLAFLRQGNPAGLSELAILHGFATTKYPDAFDGDALDLRTRTEVLWEQRDEAWSFLKQLICGPSTHLTEVMTDSLVRTLPISLLGQLLEESIEIVTGVLRRKPALALCPAFWTSQPGYQTPAAAAIALSRDVVADSADEILKTALDAAADPAPNLIEVFGPSSVSTVMDWVEADAERLARLPIGWRRAVSNHPQQLFDWLSSRDPVRPETVAFLFDMVGSEAIAMSPEGVLAFASRLPREGSAPHTVVTPLAATALRVSLLSQLSEAVELAVASFDPIYHAAAESRLPDDLWFRLTPLLPEGYLLGWWDKCYRLRAAIAERFRAGKWPAVRLSDVTRDDIAFRDIVNYLKENRSGHGVLIAAAQVMDNSSPRVKMLQI